MGDVFTIYKISIHRLYQFLQEKEDLLVSGKDISFYKEEYYSLSNDEQEEYNKALVTRYIEIIKNGLSIVSDINSNTYLGFYYKSISSPSWNDVIDKLIGEQITKPNVNHSYVLFIFIKNIVYAVCGNSGSGKISGIYERNFGLGIVPKILEENDAVIRELAEKVPRGIASSNARLNRIRTTVSNEINFEKFFKAMTLETTAIIMKELGFDDKDETNITKISAKDSLQIHRSITFDFLISVLERITDILMKEDRFSLWYLTPAIKVNKKYGKDSLDKILYKQISEGKFEIFELLPDNFYEYNTQVTKFKLYNEKEEFVIEQDILFNSSEIFKSTDRLSINRIKTIINKYKIIGSDSIDNHLIEYRIKDMSDAIIEYDDRTFYLINNEWYTIDETYIDFLNEKFRMIIENKKEHAQIIVNHFNLLNKKKLNEQEYNQSIDHIYSIAVDRKQISRVELADIILWDEKNLYLLHNKLHFNGIGSRDLSNQIITSASILSNRNDNNILASYYERINTTKIDKEGFIELFNKNIVYLAGYLSDFNINSDSTYAKYLTILTNNHVKNYNYDFYLLDLENHSD